MSFLYFLFNINAVGSPSSGGLVGSGYNGLGRSVALGWSVFGSLHKQQLNLVVALDNLLYGFYSYMY